MTASETPDQPRLATPVHGYLVVKDGAGRWYPTAELAELNAEPNGLIFIGPEGLGQWLDLPLRPYRPLKAAPSIAPLLVDLRSKFEGQA